jgi:hypothetical protein
MPRHRPNPYAATGRARFIVLWDLQWRIVDCRRLDVGIGLRESVAAAVATLQHDGWQTEGTAEFGFVFLRRDGERRLLMLTARDPREHAAQSFSPFRSHSNH